MVRIVYIIVDVVEAIDEMDMLKKLDVMVRDRIGLILDYALRKIM